MCLILVRDPDVTLNYEALKTAVHNNPHGWGYVIPDRGKLEVRRFYDQKGTDPDDVYNILDENLDKSVFIHLRWATHGQKNSKNCHPFQAMTERKDGMQVFLMHNGTMSDYKGNDDRSDTYHFTNRIVSPLLRRVVKYTGKKGLLEDPFVGDVIEKFAGGWSKFCLVDNFGNFRLLGDWTHKEGFSVSNEYSFKEEHRKPAVSTSNYSYGHSPTKLPAPTQQPIDAEWEDIYGGADTDGPFPGMGSSQTCSTNPGKGTYSIKENGVWVTKPLSVLGSEDNEDEEQEEPLEYKERTKFLELMGLKDLRELCSLQESDLLDMVTEFPEIMTVCLRDVLFELYQKEFTS